MLAEKSGRLNERRLKSARGRENPALSTMLTPDRSASVSCCARETSFIAMKNSSWFNRGLLCPGREDYERWVVEGQVDGVERES